jgi:hypothetical protein
MSNIIAGPGQGLPLPQGLSPAALVGAPFTPPTNQMSLQAGQSVIIPAGTWIVSGSGDVSALQYLDPVSGQWADLSEVGAPWITTIRSDGVNFRVANLSGVATGATVTAPGSGYNAPPTLVTPSAGNSQWQAIVGGSLGVVTMVAGGANYGIPPIVMVQLPPPPGVGAAGIAVLTAGAVTGITWVNTGAGYTFPPNISLVPAPNDPSIGVIQAASATVVLAGAGQVTGVVLKNGGMALAAEPTLTITGQGTGAAAVANPATWIAPAVDTITMQLASGF